MAVELVGNRGFTELWVRCGQPCCPCLIHNFVPVIHKSTALLANCIAVAVSSTGWRRKRRIPCLLFLLTKTDCHCRNTLRKDCPSKKSLRSYTRIQPQFPGKSGNILLTSRPASPAIPSIPARTVFHARLRHRPYAVRNVPGKAVSTCRAVHAAVMRIARASWKKSVRSGPTFPMFC